MPDILVEDTALVAESPRSLPIPLQVLSLIRKKHYDNYRAAKELGVRSFVLEVTSLPEKKLQAIYGDKQGPWELLVGVSASGQVVSVVERQTSYRQIAPFFVYQIQDALGGWKRRRASGVGGRYKAGFSFADAYYALQTSSPVQIHLVAWDQQRRAVRAQRQAIQELRDQDLLRFHHAAKLWMIDKRLGLVTGRVQQVKRDVTATLQTWACVRGVVELVNSHSNLAYNLLRASLQQVRSALHNMDYPLQQIVKDQVGDLPRKRRMFLQALREYSGRCLQYIEEAEAAAKKVPPFVPKEASEVSP
jgi:hypothetical protein